MRPLHIVLSLWLCLLLAPAAAASSPEVRQMKAAAEVFLDSLDDRQRDRAAFAFGDEERTDWHFIPRTRKGLPLSEMAEEQKSLAYALLATGTSRKGQIKALQIMSLERILQILEGEGRRFSRDPGLYHVSVFGTPSTDGTWGWRFEGHHLSLNYTVVEGRLASGTPSFLGTNPARVLSGPRKGLQVLGEEEDAARALVKSLDPGQLEKALVATEAPRDILTGAELRIDPLEHKGIAASELGDRQKRQLRRLVRIYAMRNRSELAKRDLEQIEEAGFDKVHFAWMGGLEKGQAHYYSIQGPTFLLEYDNIQNNANHVHATWREFDGDFGEDLLREHHRNHPHP